MPIQEWLSGQLQADVYDISAIDKVPFEFFAHTGDEGCSYDGVLEA